MSKNNRRWGVHPDIDEAALTRWRLAVFERDARTCQRCGKTPSRPLAHHVQYWDDAPHLRYEVSNGLTLCYSCHGRIHAGDRMKPHVAIDVLTTLRIALARIDANVDDVALTDAFRARVNRQVAMDTVQRLIKALAHWEEMLSRVVDR